MIKKISIFELVPGMVIINAENNWHRYLPLNSNEYICDEKIISLLRKSAMKEIFIDTSRSKDIKGPASAAEAVTGKKINLLHHLKNAELIHSDAKEVIADLLTNLNKHNKLDINKAEDVVQKIAENVLENQFVLAGLSMMKIKNNYLFERAVSSCILMIIFAQTYGLDTAKQLEFGIAAILFDIGMFDVPSSILNKPGQLSMNDILEIRKHAAYGYNMLKGIPDISNSALLMVVQHHERINGSGYPGGISDEKFSLAGQMAAIIDVYTAGTSDRGYKKGIPPATALGEILIKSKSEFNRELVQIFIKSVGIYPFGSLLSLKNGLVGIVTDPNFSNLIHPGLQIIYNSNEKRMVPPYGLHMQDYADNDDFKIRGVIAKEKLSLKNNDILRMAAVSN